MTDAVIPQFKGWTKPATVTEALERSLEHARLEEKWVSGDWFQTDLDEIEHDDFYGTVPAEAVEKFAKDISNMTCTDVKACSAGIVAIETLDGEALLYYLSNNQEFDSDILLRDPIAAGALTVLARAFRDVFEVRPGGEMYDSDSICQVTALNDSLAGVSSDSRPHHHAKIVRGFERAVEMSRENDAGA